MEMVLHLKRQSRPDVFVSNILVEKNSDWNSLNTVSVYSIDKIPTGKIEKLKNKNFSGPDFEFLINPWE